MVVKWISETWATSNVNEEKKLSTKFQHVDGLQHEKNFARQVGKIANCRPMHFFLHCLLGQHDWGDVSRYHGTNRKVFYDFTESRESPLFDKLREWKWFPHTIKGKRFNKIISCTKFHLFSPVPFIGCLLWQWVMMNKWSNTNILFSIYRGASGVGKFTLSRRKWTGLVELNSVFGTS